MTVPLIDLRARGRRRRLAPFRWSTLRTALRALGGPR